VAPRAAPQAPRGAPRAQRAGADLWLAGPRGEGLFPDVPERPARKQVEQQHLHPAPAPRVSATHLPGFCERCRGRRVGGPACRRAGARGWRGGGRGSQSPPASRCRAVPLSGGAQRVDAHTALPVSQRLSTRTPVLSACGAGRGGAAPSRGRSWRRCRAAPPPSASLPMRRSAASSTTSPRRRPLLCRPPPALAAGPAGGPRAARAGAAAPLPPPRARRLCAAALASAAPATRLQAPAAASAAPPAGKPWHWRRVLARRRAQPPATQLARRRVQSPTAPLARAARGR